MEEKERDERLQEIQQRSSNTEQQQFSSDRQSDLASQSVGPFCLRRPTTGPPTPQGCKNKHLDHN